MELERRLPMNWIIRSVLTLMAISAAAAELEYPAAGNIRPEAGTVEIWYELPFDVTAVKPTELWLPAHLFYVEGNDGRNRSLALRFQSLPAVKNDQGAMTRPRTDGLCISAKGGGVYLNNQRLDDETRKPSADCLCSSHVAVVRVGKKNYHLLKVE